MLRKDVCAGCSDRDVVCGDEHRHVALTVLNVALVIAHVVGGQRDREQAQSERDRDVPESMCVCVHSLPRMCARYSTRSTVVLLSDPALTTTPSRLSE